MPNHYQHVITCYASIPDGADDYALDTDKAKAWLTDCMKRLAPQPSELSHQDPRFLSDGAYDWRREHWGTKWDLYSIDARELPGDGRPLVLTFCTAWGPPHEDMRALMVCDLQKVAQSITWIGLNPYDNSTEILFQELETT